MLSSITWQEFLKTTMLCTGVYYTITILLLYRDEIKVRITGKWKGAIQPEANNNLHLDQPDSLVGDIKQDESPEVPTSKENIVSAEEIQVFNSEQTSVSDGIALNNLKDLLEEVRILLHSISENNTDKEQSIELFKSLFAKYPQLKDTKYQDAVDIFIHDMTLEQCQFELTMNEIRSCWS